MEYIVIGDLNAEIVRLQNPRTQHVEEFLTSFGLVVLISHFRQRLHFCQMDIIFALTLQLHPWVIPLDV